MGMKKILTITIYIIASLSAQQSAVKQNFEAQKSFCDQACYKISAILTIFTIVHQPLSDTIE